LSLRLPKRQDERFLQQHQSEENTLWATRGLPRTCTGTLSGGDIREGLSGHYLTRIKKIY